MARRLVSANQREIQRRQEATINTADFWREPKDKLEYYCDASVKDPRGSKWAGFGIVYCREGDWFGESHAMGCDFASWEAETEAVIAVMEHALERKLGLQETDEDFDKVKCYTDCGEVVKNIEFYRTQTTPQTHWAYHFMEKLRLLEEAGLKFECVRCLSHQERNLPNDHADDLAKEGSAMARNCCSLSSGTCGCGSQRWNVCHWSDKRRLLSVNVSGE